MNASDIMEVLAELGCDKVRYSTGNVKTCCPLAPYRHAKGSDRHPSLSIKAEDDGPSKYKCFTCDTRGNSLTGLLLDMQKAGATVPPELINKVKAAEKVNLDKKYQNYGAVFGPDLFRAFEREQNEVFPEEELSPFLGNVPRYIIDRGVTLDTCKRFDLGFDKDQQRLVFPVRRKDGALVGAMGRAISDRVQPRYMTYLPFNKSKFLYGEHLLVKAGTPTMPEAMGYNLPAQTCVIVVEGMMDVFKLHQLGYDNVVGVMTAKLSKPQILRLFSVQRPIYLMLDWDAAGYAGRVSAIKELIDGQRVYDVPGLVACERCGSRFPKFKPKSEKPTLLCADCSAPWVLSTDKKDPDQLSQEEILDCIGSAKMVSVCA